MVTETIAQVTSETRGQVVDSLGEGGDASLAQVPEEAEQSSSSPPPNLNTSNNPNPDHVFFQRIDYPAGDGTSFLHGKQVNGQYTTYLLPGVNNGVTFHTPRMSPESLEINQPILKGIADTVASSVLVALQESGAHNPIDNIWIDIDASKMSLFITTVDGRTVSVPQEGSIDYRGRFDNAVSEMTSLAVSSIEDSIAPQNKLITFEYPKLIGLQTYQRLENAGLNGHVSMPREGTSVLYGGSRHLYNHNMWSFDGQHSQLGVITAKTERMTNHNTNSRPDEFLDVMSSIIQPLVDKGVQASSVKITALPNGETGWQKYGGNFEVYEYKVKITAQDGTVHTFVAKPNERAINDVTGRRTAPRILMVDDLITQIENWNPGHSFLENT